MRICLIVAVILFAAFASQQRAAAQAPQTSSDPLRHGHALLIGNSDYSNWPRLDDVPLQLDALAEGLKNHFDTVEVVKNLKVEPLRQKINGFLRSYGNDSNARLFIYYAGHGYTEPILQYSENRGYITGIDTPSIEKGYDAARPNAMSMMEIRIPLAEVLAKHILMVFDSCFAGTIFQAREGNVAPRELTPDVVARLMEKRSRDIITAGRSNERVPAHSPIPRLLLAALNGEADTSKHGVISAAEINLYLRSQILPLLGGNLTPQQGRLQDPNFAEGEFLFRVPRSVPVLISATQPADPAAQAWAGVKDATSIAMLEQFRTLYAGSIYDPFAAARIEELKRPQTAVVVPPMRTEVLVPPVRPDTSCGGDVVTVSLSSRCPTPLSASQEHALKPKDVFKECDNCPEMVVVPRGSFTMGSPQDEPGRDKERDKDESPQHVVKIDRPFAAGRVHVTVDQFAAFVAETHYDAGLKCLGWDGAKWVENEGRSWRDPGFAQEGSHPAVCLSWNDAKAYVDWLMRKTGKAYRLLTEAEWEYAARARTAPGRYPRFWFGTDDKDLCRYGNGGDQKARDIIERAKGWAVAPCNDGYAYTSPAGHFATNDFGLHDMFGNAWQWIADCYHDSYKDAPSDGSAWTTGDCGPRVLRGGSWLSGPGGLRAAYRSRDTTEDRNSGVGFRVGRTLTP